jgi:predicted ATPase
MDIPGFRIREELTRDAHCVLCRAEAEPDASAVLVKFPLSRTASAATIASLGREHALLASLDLPGVPRARAFDGKLAALVLEDIGAIPLPDLLRSRRLLLGEFFGIARSVVQTVGELHRRRVSHRGLCPEVLLVQPGTNRTQLLDFSMASRLRRETQPASPPRLLPARLRYVSPEQTGRMNRVVDYRTDFYSLGAIFYEMLAGQPPFPFEDPLELAHGHIAMAAPAPSSVDSSIPGPLSEIVMKLLSKTAEDRYQSAWGLLADLERCASEWEENGAVAGFPLGQEDVSGEFTIPQHLYGRESETATLLEAFQRACDGPASLMLVAGYSGIGKTSLVHEVHKPIVSRRGRFVSGKFDQFSRSTPYSALLHALRSLIRQILTESDEELASWRVRVKEALGANAGVVSAVLPELDLLIGPQPAPPQVSPTDSQNRFHYAFENFLCVLARPQHPLVVFLDDLQWADSATFQLLHHLLTNPAVRDLFVIGAYRDNEVTPSHALLEMVAKIQSAGTTVHQIVLRPLRPGDVRCLVADTVRTAEESAGPLADLVFRKTAGNPFFVTQFLRSLHERGMLSFDHAVRGWTFDLEWIGRAQITDNVVDLMTRKLRTLPGPTQEAVALGACIGGSFSLQVLAAVRRGSLQQVASELWPAIEEGLLLPVTEGYEQLAYAPEEVLEDAAPTFKFLHDRVQQAADALVPVDRKRSVHLQIGRLLREGGTAGAEIFQIVNHLNLGRELMSDPEERTALAQLNLEAGRRAKESSAFRAALDYFRQGTLLLPRGSWLSHYEMTLALNMEMAEGEYLCGRFDEAERWLETSLHEARSPLEKAEVQRMRVMQCDSLARYEDALRAGRDGLALFGMALPEGEAETRGALEQELGRVGAALGDRPIATLTELPGMQDAETKAVVALSAAMWASAYILRNRLLASLLSARIVALSLERGNTADSAYGYATHAIAIGPVLGDYSSAYEWGVLALRVNERLGDRKGRARVQQQFQAHVNLWRKPLATCIPHARDACRSGLETGDFTYAGYGALSETWAALFTCGDLDRFIRDYTPTVALLERIGRRSLADAQTLFLNWAAALRGQTSGTLSLSRASFDEGEYAAAYATNPFCMAFYHAAKLHLGVMFEEEGAALEAARTARREAWAGEGTIWPVFWGFWSGLAMASRFAIATEEDRCSYRIELLGARDSMAILAESCPENFRCFALLLSAETERIEGHPNQAAALFETAIDYSHRIGNLQHEALANERCAKFWMERGQDDHASSHLGEAYRCYLAWGADAKARHLMARYGRLLETGSEATAAADVSDPVAGASEPLALDLSTVLKAAHAIAVEIELDGLLRKVMKIALESAGADHGVFLQDRDGLLSVEAEAFATGEQIRIRQSIPLEKAVGLARGVVHYVSRTGEDVVVGDAATDERFASDPRVAQAEARSILCVPVVHQGRRGGILYFENNLVTEAFTIQRIEMMRMLSGTIAIALETARLYEEMKHEVALRARAEQTAREALSELEVLKNRLEAENVYLQEEIRTHHNFEEIVGNSPALLQALADVEAVAPTSSTVVILGETGTGKELIARAIHDRSRRRDHPLVKVNCSAISAGLVESELFGHVRGAFTGAISNRTGRFELAEGGTIFLDEIGDLPLETQVKLLRVLQEREFEPVGSSSTRKVDVRVLAATNRDLEQSVRAGSFRADLYYRLNVMSIRVPPLRERVQDIPLLFEHFLARYRREVGKQVDGASEATMQRLMDYEWPGNVRELQNLVERAVVLYRGGTLELGPELAPFGHLSGAPQPSSAPAPAATVSRGRPGGGTLKDLEREHIEAALQRAAWVIEGESGAARQLGLHPNTLRSRIKKLGLRRRSGAAG